MRRDLDRRLASLPADIDERPAGGWLRAIREALYMSSAELGARMSISQSRASRLERAELEGSMRLSTLRRAAKALNCRLVYLLVPVEPLDDMVLRQAYDRAVEELSLSPSAPKKEEDREEQIEARSLQLVDSRGLWRIHRVRGSP